MEETLNKFVTTESIDKNNTILKNIENIVVLYFFLLLLKFLFAISPSIPNNFLVILDVFIFLALIFISFVFLIASIGGILLALIAGFIADKIIIINDVTTATIIAIGSTTKCKLK